MGCEEKVRNWAKDDRKKFLSTIQHSIAGPWMDTPGAEIIPRFHAVCTKWDFGESLTYRTSSQINHIIIISALLTLSNNSHSSFFVAPLFTRRFLQV